MKLERIPEYLTVTVVILIGMALAVFAGKHTGAGDMKSIGLIIGAILAAIVILQMRTRIWLLIPICWPLTGVLTFAPGSMPPRDVAILLVFVAFLVFKALKLSRIKPVFGWVDLAMLINVLYVLSVFIRNPVGTLGMGLDKVGGRPYVEIIFALLAYWVLVRVRIQPIMARKLPFLMIVGVLFQGLNGLIAYGFPSLASITGKIYGGVAADAGVASLNDPEMSRETFLADPSTSVFGLLCARFVPTSLFNPTNFFRFILTCLCVICALRSGFRIAIILMGISFCISLFFRKGILSLITIALLTLPFLGVLLGLQGNVIQLPLAAQRALSFLPAKWDYMAAGDAKRSAEWRVEIWTSVLQEGNKYIKDKVWGDGFGFTRQQLEEMTMSADTQENFRISGDYHSGPISSIRFVGCVGLALFYVLMISLALQGWRIIRSATGTPYFSLALLAATPVIVMPLFFTFIFGGYQADIVTAIFTAGLFNMIENSISADRNSIPGIPVIAENSAPPLSLGRRELEAVGR